MLLRWHHRAQPMRFTESGTEATEHFKSKTTPYPFPTVLPLQGLIITLIMILHQIQVLILPSATTVLQEP